MSPWIARRWYDTAYWFCWWFFTLMYSMRVRGRRHLPKSGPVLLVSNHQSFLDPVLIGLTARRYVSFVARDTLFHNRYLGALISSLDAIPIHHRGFSREGLQASLQKLEEGKCVLMFAEGERSRDDTVAPFKPGFSLLLNRVKCPIVPVGITGTFQCWSRYAKLPRFRPLFLAKQPGTLACSIGPAIDPKELENLDREAVLERLHSAVVTEVEAARRIRRQPRPSAAKQTAPEDTKPGS